MSRIPVRMWPSGELMDKVDIPYTPKHPLNSPFPAECPPGCNRHCKNFYEAHTRWLSLALYASQTIAKKTICVYAFSCGMDINGMKFELEPGEQATDLLKRIVPILVREFEVMAAIEREEFELRNQ